MKALKKSRKKLIMIALLVTLGAGLVAARVYLPYWLRDYVNAEIAQLDGYGGRVNAIDVDLWRGAYQMHGLDIHKTAGGLKEPFVAAKTIDLSVEWRALLEGAIVAEIDITDIDLNFSTGQTGEGGGWAHLVDALSPFDINRLAVQQGRVAYLDYAASPDVKIYIDDIAINITNLKNVEDRNVALPSDLRVSGVSIGKGDFSIVGKANILRDIPDFDIDMKLENANLKAFNNYTREAIAVDFDGGVASLYSELAASKGNVKGYLKLLARDVTVINLKTQDSNPINAVWETLVASFMQVFKNHPSDQFAMQIPVEGKIDNLDRDMWGGFISIFRNAFGRAFKRDTDGQINFSDAFKK